MAIRDQLISKIWHGKDPFENFPIDQYETDDQGWRSDHPYILETISANSPKIVVEVGVWKGRAVRNIANIMKNNDAYDGVVIAVDTWLGASNLWSAGYLHDELRFKNGYPNLYYCFAANVVASGLQNYVLPLPLDSVNAAMLLQSKGIKIDAIHIDAGHDYPSVYNDLSAWWPLLNTGGVLICDDYDVVNIEFPEVVRAVDDFLKTVSHRDFVVNDGKCKTIKSA